MKLTVERYIQVDENHQIEVLSNGHFYPQYLTNMYVDGPKDMYAYYRKGNKQTFLKTEKGALQFIARQTK